MGEKSLPGPSRATAGWAPTPISAAAATQMPNNGDFSIFDLERKPTRGM